MINLLKIEDLGVIADAELPLSPGFTAITGETGAGKTMVITALGLLMGERSDSGAVRLGAQRARVSGFLNVQDPRVIEMVEDAGGELDTGGGFDADTGISADGEPAAGELSIVRTVSSEGRSRASVGGVGAPAQVLQKIAPHLFAVHGQSEQLRLKSAVAQRETLDRFGGEKLLKLIKEHGRIFDESHACEEELESLQNEKLERAREADRLRAELQEISEVDPQANELDELHEKIVKLNNLEELRQAAKNAWVNISGDEQSETSNAVVLLADAIRDLEKVAQNDEELRELNERIVSVAVQLDEVSRELSEYVNSLDYDSARELAEANERYNLLVSLTRKFGVDTAEVLEYQEKAAERLENLAGDDSKIEELTKKSAQLTEKKLELQKSLTKQRVAAAKKMSENVTKELKHLALPNATFVVEITLAKENRSGADSVEMMLQPHEGSVPRPLAKGASGGELSRVMLAIEVVLAGKDPVPTFVFDEVDAGIGGQAAIEIGRRLAKLAETSQVIVVTHLAQVAAFAQTHLVVQKDSAGGFTKSSCKALNGDERLTEMARLLSGMTDSQSALDHAEELLSLATL